MLPDVEAGADESEDPHLAAQLQQIAVGDARAAVPTAADIEQVEVRRQLVGRRVRRLFAVERRSKPAPDEGQFAPIGLVPRAGGESIRVRLELTLVAPDRRPQLVADLRQAGRLTQVPRQLTNAFAVAG